MRGEERGGRESRRGEGRREFVLSPRKKKKSAPMTVGPTVHRYYY